MARLAEQFRPVAVGTVLPMPPTLPMHLLQPGDGVPIVLVHGFTQNARCWSPFDRLLAERSGRPVFGIDAPGHGEADPTVDSANLWETAELLADVARRSFGHHVAPDWIGYSMGGRAALHLGLAHPEAVRSLCVIGASPGLAIAAEREERMRADDLLADHLIDVGLATFLEEWLALPLFAGLPREVAHVEVRLQNRSLGLAASLRACGTGAQDDLRHRLVDLQVPTLMLAGSADTKFSGLAREVALLAVNVTADEVPDAGHTAHLERPVSTARSVSRWLSEITEDSD